MSFAALRSSFMMAFIVELFCVDEGYCNGKNCHDDGNWEPRVLGLHPRAERHYNDGDLGWDGDEHCANRLRSYFEFHSMMGEMPPAY